MVKRAGGSLLLSVAIDPGRSGRSARSSTWPARDDPVRRLLGRRAAAGEPDAGARPRSVAHDGDRGVRPADRRRAGRIAHRLGHLRQRALRADRPKPPDGGVRAARQPRAAAVGGHGRGGRALRRRQRLPHVPRAFTTALPAFDAFPMAQWARLSAKYWRGGRDDLMGYGDPAAIRACAGRSRRTCAPTAASPAMPSRCSSSAARSRRST